MIWASLVYHLIIAQWPVCAQVRTNVPLGSIRLSDPCILADAKTAIYYRENRVKA